MVLPNLRKWTRCVAAAFSFRANWSSFEMPSKPVFVEHGEGCWSGIIFLDQFRFEFFLRWLWWVQLGLIRTNTVLTEAFSNQSLRHNITNPILGNEVCLKPFYTGCNALVLVQLIISDKKEFLRGSKFWPIFSLGMYLQQGGDALLIPDNSHFWYANIFFRPKKVRQKMRKFGKSLGVFSDLGWCDTWDGAFGVWYDEFDHTRMRICVFFSE